jgi:hypothetical protein
LEENLNFKEMPTEESTPDRVSMSRAYGLIATIERNIALRKFRKGMLYETTSEQKWNSAALHSGYNLALALAYLRANADMKTGSKIICGIENKIGFAKNGLLLSRNKGLNCYTQDSAMLAIAYSHLDEKKKARDLVARIEKHIGFGEIEGRRYVYVGDELMGMFTLPNVLMASAYLSIGERDKARELIMAVEKFVGFEKYSDEQKLAYEDFSRQTINTPANAALATAYFDMMNPDGNKIIYAIDSRIGCYHSQRGSFAKYSIEDYYKPELDHLIYCNALLAVAFDAKARFELEKNGLGHNRL